MYDLDLTQEIIANIIIAIERIERRFKTIEIPDDFVTSNAGIDRLDAITMMLIAIGEQIKRLDKVLPYDLTDRYPEVDWKGAKGIRDFLSHHYFIVDAEIIFDVCQNKLSELKRIILELQKAQ